MQLSHIFITIAQLSKVFKYDLKSTKNTEQYEYMSFSKLKIKYSELSNAKKC